MYQSMLYDSSLDLSRINCSDLTDGLSALRISNNGLYPVLVFCFAHKTQMMALTIYLDNYTSALR